MPALPGDRWKAQSWEREVRAGSWELRLLGVLSLRGEVAVGEWQEQARKCSHFVVHRVTILSAALLDSALSAVTHLGARCGEFWIHGDFLLK